RVVPENAAEALGGLIAAVGDDHHARVLRIAHADAAAVVERHPGRAARGVEERVEEGPVAHSIAAIAHRFGLAVWACDRSRIEMVAADHDGRLEFALCYHLIQ